MCYHNAVFLLGLSPWAESEDNMATSSITANFRIDDPKAARAFVDALCSETAARPNLPNVMETYFESAIAERDFFLKKPYARRRRAK